MAEGKKSFVLYSDQKALFDQLPNDKAGELIKFIFAYVNDENPETDDIILNIAFTPIKQQLKRDLSNWEEKKEGRSNSGREGNLKRWHNDIYKDYKSGKLTLDSAEELAKNRKASHSDNSDRTQSQSIANIAVNDNVNVNVNVNDTVNDNTKYYYEKDNLKLSEEEKEKICQKYDILILDEYISRVENWNKKHKVKSLYLTVLNWIRKDEKQNQTLNANQQTQSPDGVQQWKPIRDATF